MSAVRRVAVLGATGNVGLATTRTLAEAGHDVLAVARRVPADGDAAIRWVERDVARDDLVPLLEGVDVVVHLAWQIQPSRDLSAQWAVNVDAFDRVLDHVRRAGVSTLVVVSSVGAYSRRKGPDPVDESWPTHGVAASSYSRQKAYVERMLDAFEATCDTRVVRFRPSLIFQRASASEQRRLFAGALLPNRLFGVSLPVFPDVSEVAFQAVHADDVADAIRRVAVGDASGPFNLAAPDVLTTRDVADWFGARALPVSFSIARAAAAATWHLRLHPVSPGWLDLARRSPLLDCGRARDELGWRPAHRGRDALAQVLEGIAEGAGATTPTLQPDRAGRDLATELRTRQGAVYSRDPAATPPDRPLPPSRGTHDGRRDR